MAIRPESDAPPRFTFYGGCEQLLDWIEGLTPAPSECLIEGPGGSGKSRSIGEFLLLFAESYPGCRILVLRKTRVSLTDSWLVTWETEILDPGDPLLDGPGRANRHSYVLENGSEIVVGGMDNPTRLFSTQYDLVYCNEANELLESEWESLHRALRNWKAPFQLLLGDCNPDSPSHWLNRRCNRGATHRIRTRHADNPSLRPAYLERLSKLTGVRRKRLYEGVWAAAEGMVWETFDPEVNIATAPRITAGPRKGAIDLETLGIRRCIGSQDWGSTAPGSLSAYGQDGDGRIYRLAQFYAPGKLLEWWVDRAAELYREFSLDRIVADPSRPDCINAVNKRLLHDHGVSGICRGADNTKSSSGAGDLAGLDLVREGFRPAPDGKPRIILFRDTLRERSAELDEAGQPCCTEEEIPGYVFDRDTSDRVLERTDADVPDHGCDELRYACTELWLRVPNERDASKDLKPGTMGWLAAGRR